MTNDKTAAGGPTPTSARIRHCMLLAVAAVALLASSVARAADTIELTGDPWPPYVIGELGGEATGGVGVKLIREIFARIEAADVAFPLEPWERALRDVRDGRRDGVVILLKTPEREDYMRFTGPIFAAENLVWYSRDRFPEGFDWTTFEDLGRYSIGVIRGYSYGDAVDAAIASGVLRTVEATTGDRLFAMLAHGRVDLAFASDVVGHAFARAHTDRVRFDYAPTATATETYHIGFSKHTDAHRLVPEIDRVVAELHGEGRIAAIIRGQD